MIFKNFFGRFKKFFFSSKHHKNLEENQIGIFNDFWDGKHPHHLPLLNLNELNEEKDWNLRISVSRLDKIFSTNPRQKVISDMELLINQVDWRPHLIFCLALLKLSET